MTWRDVCEYGSSRERAADRMDEPNDVLTVGVAVIGAGLVGGELLDQIDAQAKALRGVYGVAVCVHAIASSTRMRLSSADAPEQRGIELSVWRTEWEAGGGSVALDLDVLVAHLKQNSPHVIVCDCTASELVSQHYCGWLSQGVHVVTPNKKANSSTTQQYKALRTAQRQGPRSTHFLYEANVGAGLPILSTIRDFQRTGDTFLEIAGVFSGTLSFIFNSFDGSRPFSEIVAAAKLSGYTEPDPRDDLSGMDVARKVVILAREIGLEVELDQVPVKSLVPQALGGPDVSTATFMDRLPEFDSELAVMASEAAQRKERLRYVGWINVNSKTCGVELKAFPESHPFGALEGSDNIVLFRTRRYDAQPLTIRGPGAGAAVTAAGVFADVLRVVSYLGAPARAIASE
ncbi:Bifunctional aspartokinase/homoserine dehydrogenase 1, chloroplastic [Porphyridium purpureum]|uniref:Homoserine dehydrogenase n=1 Tax=Porphyridium purpureum TaxID=35688 RepID=A0A5J4YJL5_PORPP|nr:Bifunctional aspartokinase/homoserine dehydrogenase 1, chloroplastic [Porphyridium purpureum]|eukprot:POR5819..scf210_14